MRAVWKERGWFFPFLLDRPARLNFHLWCHLLFFPLMSYSSFVDGNLGSVEPSEEVNREKRRVLF